MLLEKTFIFFKTMVITLNKVSKLNFDVILTVHHP